MKRDLLCLFVIVCSALGVPLTAQAEKTKQSMCPFCQQPIVKDDSQYDNTVVLVYKGRSQSYRCVLCAVADAKMLAGDVIIVAPSEMKRQPVKIVRVDGKWSVTPENTIFAFAPGNHEQCQNRYRAMSSQAAFQAYAAANKKLFGDTKAYSLKELIDGSK